MAAPGRPIYRAVFVFVLAPIGAAVVVAALLLFGVAPRSVFFVGLAVKSWLHAPNAVGVLVTVFLWWAIIATVGLLWDRRRRRNTT